MSTRGKSYEKQALNYIHSYKNRWLSLKKFICRGPAILFLSFAEMDVVGHVVTFKARLTIKSQLTTYLIIKDT